MSWALEAIEAAAMKRAETKIAQFNVVTLMGLDAAQVNAFLVFFKTRSPRDPAELTPEEIHAELKRMAK